MYKKLKVVFAIGTTILIISLEIVLSSILLYWQFRLGQVRFFDIDEFAHLHWAHNAFFGERPYTDFFYFFPPLFLYVLRPLFVFFPVGAGVLLLARGLSFVIFSVVSLSLFFLVKKIKGAKTAFLTIFIFVFLPIPADKWLEIRPDGLALAAALLGIFALVSGLKKDGFWPYCVSGFFFGLGVSILPKTAFFPLAAVLVVIVADLIFKKKRIIPFCLGGLIPASLMLLLLSSYGNLGQALYFVTTVATNATKVLGQKFPLPPSFLFIPNDVYYGKWGYSLPWVTNIIVWLLASLWGIKHFISFLQKKETQESLIQLLIAGSFLMNMAAFTMIAPLKHGQYLIPLSPFIAYFFADLVLGVVSRLGQFSHWLKVVGMLILPVMILVLFLGKKEFYEAKMQWDTQYLSHYDELYTKLLPKDEAIFDLTGETVFFKEGYYFCCIPYGQYEEVLTFPYPDLEKELRRKKVKIIYVHDPGRLSVLPAFHQKVINRYYVVSDRTYFFVPGTVLKFKTGEREKEFELITDGSFAVLWKGAAVNPERDGEIFIDGWRYTGGPMTLTEGRHVLKTNLEGEVTIRYKMGR